MLSFMVTFLPSNMKVFFCRLGFHTFLVWRIEKLILLPYCLPLPVISHFCMVAYAFLDIQGLIIGDNASLVKVMRYTRTDV